MDFGSQITVDCPDCGAGVTFSQARDTSVMCPDCKSFHFCKDLVDLPDATPRVVHQPTPVRAKSKPSLAPRTAKELILVACPECKGHMKIPAASKAVKVQCPHCEEPLAADKLEVVEVIESGKKLPEQREIDPAPVSLSDAPEVWEYGEKELKDIDFDLPIRSTEDDELKLAPGEEPQERRRVGKSKEQMGWDSETPPDGDEDSATPEEQIEAEEKKRKLALVPIIIGVAGVALLGVLTFFFIGSGLFDDGSDTESTPARHFSGDPEEVLAAMRSFASASTVDALLEHVRERERVEPIIRKYYEESPLEPFGEDSVPDADSLWRHNEFMVGQFSHARFGGRFGAVEKIGERYLIDWEGFVGHCETPWDTFTRTRTKEPTVLRVTIQPGSYYENAFRDQSKFAALTITDVEGSRPVYGYLARESAAIRAFGESIKGDQKIFATIRGRYLPGTLTDQFLIEDFITRGWITNYSGKGGVSFTAPAADGSLFSDSNTFEPDKVVRDLNKFLEAPTIDDFVLTIRDRARVEPLVREYFKEGYIPVGSVKPPDPNSLTPHDEFVIVPVSTTEYGKQFAVLEDLGGRFLVDWEAFVGHCEVPWETFVQDRVTDTKRMRVLIQRGDYYNYEYSDDSEYTCFLVTDMIAETRAYGYARKGSKSENRLKAALFGERTVFGIITAKFLPSAKDDQFLLEAYVRKGWVMNQRTPPLSDDEAVPAQ